MIYHIVVWSFSAKTLNYDSFGVCIKIGCKCFLTTLQNFLTIFDNMFLWTPYKAPMFCSPSPLPNICNDIATFPSTNTITLSYVSFLFKYMPNLSHKTLKILYFSWVYFLNSLSIHNPNTKYSTNPNIHS